MKTFLLLFKEKYGLRIRSTVITRRNGVRTYWVKRNERSKKKSSFFSLHPDEGVAMRVQNEKLIE